MKGVVSTIEGQQMRFNSGKPKLSYLFTNSELVEQLMGYDERCRSVPAALTGIAKFLGREVDALDLVLRDILVALQAGLSGDPEPDCTLDLTSLLAECPDALAEYSAVCVFGEGKYARGNFRKGAPVTQYLDSALRHLLAYLRGEVRDPESGKHHLAHAFWNVWEAAGQPAWRDDRLPARPSKPEPNLTADAPFDLPEPVSEIPPPPRDSDRPGYYPEEF